MMWTARETKGFLFGLVVVAMFYFFVYSPRIEVSSPALEVPASINAGARAPESVAVAPERIAVAPERIAVAPPVKTAPHIERRSCLQGDTSDAYYDCRRAALLKGCSEICDTNNLGKPSKFFNYARKHVDCDGIWMNEETDASLTDGQWPPPDYPPPKLLADYQQEGRVQVIKRARYAERFLGGSHSEWTEAWVEKLRAEARAGTLWGTYGLIETDNLRQGLKNVDLTGKRVMVIGSAGAWVEALVLEAGAGEVWTLEYGKIKSTHPKVFTMTPDDARLMYIAGTIPKFDAVVTYSSVEHSGLGRFGDALNPWGDMQAMARAWCITRPGGNLILAVMECGPTHISTIEFNLHRCYRNVSYTHLTANWEQVWRGPIAAGQPVQIFSRAETFPSPRSGG